MITVGRDTTKLYEAMQAFVAQVKNWEGEELLGEVYDNLTEQLPAEERAMLIFHLLAPSCDNNDPEQLSAQAKKFAVDVAEVMGPDWAQWLYKFTVLVTKLA